MNKSRFVVLTSMVLAAALCRIIPHPHNFSPIAALALFGGAQFASRRAAFLVPLTAMFFGDLVLGLHALIPVIYGCFALIVCLGFWVRGNRSVLRVGAAAVAASVLFFVVSNLAVWGMSGLYPLCLSGLAACYTAAVPFFWNTICGDLFYSFLLFGGLAMAEWRVPRLREWHPVNQRALA